MSYQSMKEAFLNAITFGQRQRAKAREASFDPDEFLRTFRALPNDAARYIYLRSQPSFSQPMAMLNSRAVNFGAWVNAMDYNALLGGYSVHSVRWTPQGFVGPNGPLPRDAKMTWATVGGVPAFNGELILR